MVEAAQGLEPSKLSFCGIGGFFGWERWRFSLG